MLCGSPTYIFKTTQFMTFYDTVERTRHVSYNFRVVSRKLCQHWRLFRRPVLIIGARVPRLRGRWWIVIHW